MERVTAQRANMDARQHADSNASRIGFTQVALTDAGLLHYPQARKPVLGFGEVRLFLEYLFQFLFRFPDAAEPFVTQGHIEVDGAEIGFHLAKLGQLRGPGH